MGHLPNMFVFARLVAMPEAGQCRHSSFHFQYINFYRKSLLLLRLHPAPSGRDCRRRLPPKDQVSGRRTPADLQVMFPPGGGYLRSCSDWERGTSRAPLSTSTHTSQTIMVCHESGKRAIGLSLSEFSFFCSGKTMGNSSAMEMAPRFTWRAR